MKNTFKLRWIIAMLALIFAFAACDNGNGRRGIICSVQVNNQAAERSVLTAADEVELFISNLEYCEDITHAGGMLTGYILVANGDRNAGEGVILNNAGWYSVNTQWEALTVPFNVPHTIFCIHIEAMRVNGSEFQFDPDGHDVFFGTSSWNQDEHAPGYIYPRYNDNFTGVDFTGAPASIKTILTVHPDIMNCWDENGDLKSPQLPPDNYFYDPSLDPYEYITVEGRINE
jgi:hypothetical protein